MSENTQIKRTKGQRGKAKTPIWQYDNKLTGESQKFVSLPEIAKKLGVCVKTVYNLAHNTPIKNHLLKQIYESITITRIKKN